MNDLYGPQCIDAVGMSLDVDGTCTYPHDEYASPGDWGYEFPKLMPNVGELSADYNARQKAFEEQILAKHKEALKQMQS